MTELEARQMVLKRIILLRELSWMYQAEADGLIHGLYGYTAVPQIDEDAERRKAYQLGYQDALEILAVGGVVRA